MPYPLMSGQPKPRPLATCTNCYKLTRQYTMRPLPFGTLVLVVCVCHRCAELSGEDVRPPSNPS